MAGNNEDTFGQKVVDGGKGAKLGGHDSLITEKSGVTGAAKPETKPIDPTHNVARGQEVH